MVRQRQPGHRQRGAGTVSVSKEDTIRQGVMCKEWQRTPMQLLQEFCHSKKRRNAFYARARSKDAAKFRMRCVLPDVKDSSKDLSFCPEQEFDTQDDAKHCAALLALKHVEPLRPHERKLPDPYRSLWLSLDSQEKVEAKTIVNRNSDKQQENLTPRVEKETMMETITLPTLDIWGTETEEITKKANSSEKTVKLTMDRQFASHKAFESAKLAQMQAKNKKQRARDNRDRANRPKSVMMSVQCRELIENVLRLLNEEELGKKTMQMATRVDENQQEEMEQGDREKTRQRLKGMGFTASQIQKALDNCNATSTSDEAPMVALLDWLCLHIPEGELPMAFNPEGSQLDVVLTSFQTSRTTVFVQRLMKFGYDRQDAVSVATAFVEEHFALCEEEFKTPTLKTLFALLEMLFPYVQSYFGLKTRVEPIEAMELLFEQRQDELMALESIYDDKLQITVLDDVFKSQLLEFKVSDSLRLFICLSRTSMYPFEFPLVALTSTELLHEPHLLAACGKALQSCARMLGDPMLYDIVVSIDAYFQDAKRLATSLPRIRLIKPIVAPRISEFDTIVEAVPKKSILPRNKERPFKKLATKSISKRVDMEHTRKISGKLLQLRNAKDRQQLYTQMLATRAKLPAAKEAFQVIECVQNNQVVLVCGATGCGKTTQIPQFILDDYITRGVGGECSIICTQPRRIAALGVATRVAQERCEAIGDVVGYQIRLEAKKSSHTRLLFCTTGVLLRRLLHDRQLADISHVIVDEVHERNVDTDFLLSILRDLLPQRPAMRVILMSATMNADLFVTYFTSKKTSPCPVVTIPGFTYPVAIHFIDTILEDTQYKVPTHLLKAKKVKKVNGDTHEKKAPFEMTFRELAAHIDDTQLDYDLIVHLVQYLVTTKSRTHGAILIFLPGTAEIKRLIQMLTHGDEMLSSKIWALPLHGSLSGSDQAKVFQSPPTGKSKVIVSTNIAETSITINDITAVIDSGKVKEMVYDHRSRRSQLLDCWASRAACDQRKGRAGRVQAGTCYRLFSRERFAVLEAQLSAEIHRVSLEQVCLQVKTLNLGSIKGFLSKAIEPPCDDAIDAAIQALVDISAFQRMDMVDDNSSGSHTEDLCTERVVLTPLGNHLAMLPLDARIGKFLVYGSILRCIEPVAIIAACISSRSPFVMSMSDPNLRAKQDALKKKVGGSWKSDHLLLWKIVEEYARLRGQKLQRGFCRDGGLLYDSMESIVELQQQYLQQLATIGFYDATSANQLNENATAPRIIKAALCAGLYANVAQVVYPEQKYFQAAHGVIEKDYNAQAIRYFVPSGSDPRHRERVFLHPSSCNFTQNKYDSPWLVYTELVQTSKVFIRESTMVNSYALLLFGGQLEVLHEKNLLVLDDMIHFHAVARIGVLIKSIRQHLDHLLMEKIANPTVDIAQSELVTAISILLKSEGMYAAA